MVATMQLFGFRLKTVAWLKTKHLRGKGHVLREQRYWVDLARPDTNRAPLVGLSKGVLLRGLYCTVFLGGLFLVWHVYGICIGSMPS